MHRHHLASEPAKAKDAKAAIGDMAIASGKILRGKLTDFLNNNIG